jgi:hypothetical protein
MKYFALLALFASHAAPPRFEPVQPELLSAGGSFTNAWADYDGDGDLDLFVGFGGRTANRLYRNDTGVLVDVASETGIAEARGTLSAAWGDYDGDGDPDLLVGFAPGPDPVLKLYRNDGARFAEVGRATGVARDSGRVRQVVWVDYDGDSDLDLFVAFRERANAMFRNEGGNLSDVAAEIGLADGRRTVGAAWFDYDEDGDLDLYAGNMDGDANGLMRNDAGRFVDVAAEAGLAWGGRAPGDATNGTVRPCIADVNNDGRLDVFTANYGRNGLFLNRGAGRFTDASREWGIDIDGRYDSCALADFDNDGRLDLYVNGTVTGGTSYRDYLFHNTGAAFLDVTPDNIRAIEADHGAQWADFDGDGDEDLALTGVQPTGMHLVMRNQLPRSRDVGWLRVMVTDTAGRPAPGGGEVRVYATATRRLLGTRMLDTGSGYNSQNVMPLHFGLARENRVDIEVIAPGSHGRRMTRLRNMDAGAWSGCVLPLRLAADGGARMARKGC